MISFYKSFGMNVGIRRYNEYSISLTRSEWPHFYREMKFLDIVIPPVAFSIMFKKWNLVDIYKV